MKPSRVDRKGAGSGGIEANGILDSRMLPDDEQLRLWDAIIVPDRVKDQLLGQAVLNFVMRPKVNPALIPLHGIILLTGPPGTGKTSLARGLASRAAQSANLVGAKYVEVDPHALTSAALGKSQRAVTDLLGTTIAEAASASPLIVLLDEVETLAPARHKLSLEANPIDVHRATDAVLAQVDLIARENHQVLFIATTNFPEIVDEAFASRADLAVNIGLPTPEATKVILRNALTELARHWPAARHLNEPKTLEAIAKACVGLDARRIGKLVPAACAALKETASDPGKLKADALIAAAEQAKAQLRGVK